MPLHDILDICGVNSAIVLEEKQGSVDGKLIKYLSGSERTRENLFILVIFIKRFLISAKYANGLNYFWLKGEQKVEIPS